MEVLSETLKYPGETHPRNLALALVDAAKNPSLVQKGSDCFGCCSSAKDFDKGTLLDFFPSLEDTDPFDKIPVIAWDNVDFDFFEGDKLFNREQSSFGEFISCLFEYAYTRKILVLRGVSNLYLVKELVALKGTTKIIPADVLLGLSSRYSAKELVTLNGAKINRPMRHSLMTNMHRTLCRSPSAWKIMARGK